MEVSNSDFVLENVHIGSECYKLYQMPSGLFNEGHHHHHHHHHHHYHHHHQACKQTKGDEDRDNTGLRIYLGCFCCIKLLQSSNIKLLLKHKRVLEVGAGAGVLSLMGLRNTDIKLVTITDGNDSAVHLAKMNMDLMSEQELISCECQVVKLAWDDPNDDNKNFLQTYNNSNKYDVIIGSDLMYYNIDVNQLIDTVLLLMDPIEGVFIHAHVFRRYGQKQEFIDVLKQHGYISVRIPIETFVNSSECSHHPDWHSTCCILTSTIAKIDQLVSMYPEWEILTEDVEIVTENFHFSDDFFE